MASKKLKLYVWEGVLTDWNSGITFAFATSPEQAVEEIKKAGMTYEDKWDGILLDGQAPREYTEPVGFYMYGSC